MNEKRREISEYVCVWKSVTDENFPQTFFQSLNWTKEKYF